MSETLEKNKIIEGMLLKATGKLETAKRDLQANAFDDAVSRTYYAVFHAIRAVLFNIDLTFSSHSSTIGMFNKEFVKSGIFPKGFNKLIIRLFEDRQTGDYDTWIEIDEETATSLTITGLFSRLIPTTSSETGLPKDGKYAGNLKIAFE